MNLKENNIFGRKVFFLLPSFDFQNIIIDRLFNLEYEVYTIHSIADAKNILIHYPDAICFINIDSCLESIHWLNFIHSFELDPVLSTIFLGIISHNNRDKDRELFLLNAVIPAGFISTAVNYEELTKTFVQILDLNGAMGRRKYIRVDCSHDRFVYAKLQVSSRVYDIKIKDISSVGFSVDVPIEYKDQIKTNLVIRNCTIKLHDKAILEPCTIIIVKPHDTMLHVVFVFLKGMSYASKTAIRSYIHSLLQKKLSEILKGCVPDTTDYALAPEIPEGASCPFLLSSYEQTSEELESIDSDYANSLAEDDFKPFDKDDLGVTDLF